MRFSSFPRAMPLVALMAALTTSSVQAHEQHAHVHGKMSMDVAIDAKSITISLDTPLDNLLGFERAPRTDAEKRRAQEAIAALNAANSIFAPDPAGGCTLGEVKLDSDALKLGQHAKTHQHGSDHAELQATVLFNCTQADRAQFIDVKLFDRFKRTKQIDVQVVSPNAQVKRTLKPTASRLSWSR